MKRNLLIAALFVIVALALAVPATAAKSVPQTKCAVCAVDVDKKVFTDYKGMRVYVCCNNCATKFQADPDTYLKKMRAEGVMPEKAPTQKKAAAGCQDSCGKCPNKDKCK